MLEFAKTLGIGLLAVILSPFILLLFVIYVIYTLLVYVFHELCSIVFFFSGKNFKNDDAETYELLAVKEEYAKIIDNRWLYGSWEVRFCAKFEQIFKYGNHFCRLCTSI